MAFWSDPNTEPKRSFRWLLYVGGIPTWVIKSTKKPSYEVKESSHQYINHTFYFPGRLEWASIDVTVVDAGTPDSSKILSDIVKNAGYHLPEDPNDVSTISKAGAVNALGRVSMVQLNAEGGVAEEWVLKNAWVSKVNFGDLDYSKDEMVQIQLTIRFDYAELTVAGPGIEPAGQ